MQAIGFAGKEALAGSVILETVRVPWKPTRHSDRITESDRQRSGTATESNRKGILPVFPLIIAETPKPTPRGRQGIPRIPRIPQATDQRHTLDW